MLLVVPDTQAAGGAAQASGSSQGLAFARYVTSQDERDPLATSGPVGMLIEGSLPALYKSATLLALRTPGATQRSELQLLEITGDGTVAEEVIDRYFALRDRIDAMPLFSVAVTPANYKFHFAGEVKTGGATAYIYDIAPKKSRPGMLTGRVWIDSQSGHEVMLTGHALDIPASGGINVVRDTKLVNGSAYARITHVAFTIPRLGPAELVITEAVLNGEAADSPESLVLARR
jgi:hypothetical protein